MEIRGSEKQVILIIEDDPALSRMYHEKFELEGFRVLVAKDGEEALDLVLNQKIDLILLDVLLPKINGLEFLERIRQEPNCEELPVIVLTNVVMANERERALKLGAKEYLVKAMQTPEQVVEKVVLHLNEG